MVKLDDDIMRKLRANFLAESDEQIQAISDKLLALEQGPVRDKRAALLEAVARDCHNLKGSAGAADIVDVEQLAHGLESALGGILSQGREPTPTTWDLLYETLDTIEDLLTTNSGAQRPELDLASLHRRLDAVGRGEQVTADDELAAAAVDKPTGAGRDDGGRLEGSGPTRSDELVEEPVSREEPATSSAQARNEDDGRSSLSAGTEESIRVSTDKLDSLMTQAGELMVAGLKIDQRLKELEAITHRTEEWNREWLKTRAGHSQVLHDEGDDGVRPLLRFLNKNERVLKELAAEVNDLWRGLSRDALLLSRVTSDVSEEVMKVRMLPIATVLNLLPRIVRDLARRRGKEIDLVVRGADTELDRNILEEIKDPLIHLVRNAVDHGIEPLTEREALGKRRMGTVTIHAYQKGSNIVVEVADDGAGIDIEAVKKAARRHNLLSGDELEAISDEQAMNLIFASGLSTAETITDTSGRGVGLDVVRRNVEALHGHVDVASEVNRGTSITLTLPLTLATTQELLVRVRDQTFGIPISAVERIQRVLPESISTVEGKEAITVNGQPISLVELSDVLEMGQEERTVDSGEKLPVVILGAGRRRIAFLVDGVVGQQESVVKTLGKQLARVRNVAGATILGTGQVIMTLNPSDLLKSAYGSAGRTDIAARIALSSAEEQKQTTVLVVDDAVATRNLEKNILETVGYRVQVASDGAEALGILRSNGGCDVVVSDIVMPNLDGFGLTQALRDDPNLADTPVILVTSLESAEDKERGLKVGADAYIVKSGFDQDTLLDAVGQLT